MARNRGNIPTPRRMLVEGSDDLHLVANLCVANGISMPETFYISNKEGIDNIIAVGGDGTINKVLNGFYNENGKRISSSRFGVIHTGTSPDFCKSYNIPTNPMKAADLIIGQQTRSIPVGMIKAKKQEKLLRGSSENYPLWDFNKPSTRNAAAK